MCRWITEWSGEIQATKMTNLTPTQLTCDHRKFKAVPNVVLFEDANEKVTKRILQVRIRCIDCNAYFSFNSAEARTVLNTDDTPRLEIPITAGVEIKPHPPFMPEEQ
jgi:hypothetical protein